MSVRAPECGTAAPYVSVDENNVRGGLKTLRFVCSTPSNQKKKKKTYTAWRRGKFQIEEYTWAKHTPQAINVSINEVMTTNTHSVLAVGV